MNQDELLDTLEDEREKFLDAIEGLSDEALQEPGVTGNWSVKDILSHISMWEAELIKLLWQASQGQKPATKQITQTSVDDTNAAWHEHAKDRPLEDVWSDFEAVRRQTTRRVQSFSDKDLNDPQYYTWLKGRLLWEWIASDSFEHDAEHAAEIRAWRASRGL